MRPPGAAVSPVRGPDALPSASREAYDGHPISQDRPCSCDPKPRRTSRRPELPRGVATRPRAWSGRFSTTRRRAAQRSRAGAMGRLAHTTLSGRRLLCTHCRRWRAPIGQSTGRVW